MNSGKYNRKLKLYIVKRIVDYFYNFQLIFMSNVLHLLFKFLKVDPYFFTIAKKIYFL